MLGCSCFFSPMGSKPMHSLSCCCCCLCFLSSCSPSISLPFPTSIINHINQIQNKNHTNSRRHTTATILTTYHHHNCHNSLCLDHPEKFPITAPSHPNHIRSSHQLRSQLNQNTATLHSHYNHMTNTLQSHHNGMTQSHDKGDIKI